MNRLGSVVIAALVGFAAFAEKTGVQNMTDAERAARRARIKEMRLKTSGGIVERPGSQQGRVVIFNCQKTVGEDAIKKTAAELTESLGVKFEVMSRGAVSPVKDGPASLKAEGAEFGVFVVEDADSPCSLGVYPEQRFAVINVKVLGAAPERTRKELYRAVPFLCGGLSTSEPKALMQAVSVPFDLDTIDDVTLPWEAVNRMMPYLRSFGVTPLIRRSYKTACAEGWAPQPTNDYQKAIWDKAHALPKNPMKIEFDPKKGR